MNVLVLGATSAIGSQLANEFAAGNRLTLVGRNAGRLEKAAQKCREAGASFVNLLAADLDRDYADIEEAARKENIELIVNAASATSRLRDNELDPDRVAAYAAVDLVAPLRLVQTLSKARGTAPFGVIFISTLLAVVRSPNRSVYGGLKSSHEVLLKRAMGSHPSRRLLLVRVATPLPTDEIVGRTVALAKAVKTAFERNQQVILFGAAGRILRCLYLAQPLVFGMVVEIQRKLRRDRSE